MIKPLYKQSEKLVKSAAADLGMDKTALFTLRGHATAAALARTGYLDYAHAMSGGSRVNLQRFGADRMERLIEDLTEWLKTP